MYVFMYVCMHVCMCMYVCFPSCHCSPLNMNMVSFCVFRTQLKRSPIDNVLFLQNRGRSKLSGCGILISSDHGEGSFWDLFGSEEPVGSFPLTLNQDEHAMALATDHQNHHLVAGDTGGSISIFDIRDYCMVSGRVSP